MSDTKRQFNVLFLCTGNSCRSILAEAYLNHAAGDRFKAYSAGSHPKGQVHPLALETLRVAGLPTTGLSSKGWEAFEGPGAPALDFVITTCDSAANEVCPIWPGQPMNAHWPFPDPDAFQGTETETKAHFLDVFRQIRTRIDIFANLPLASLDKLSLQKKLDEIGKTAPAPSL
ncbi:protein tyrosine phosphatase [Tepidicaulis marinus]|uniref:Protein tyrosine phosphatase n=1 Tax=Tepidicaulis marinus TaxID=1333998 RepID=A0A081B8C3_9HYPH|nr:arsenate reductase ArsC [Tepidicaulis marinus]GAK44291.1 protein tyrosine phosphatase [Tepidicaulis marinus]